MMDQLAPPADRLAFISRDIALVPKEERRALFVERAKAVGSMVRDGLLDAAAVHDKLWSIAQAHDLVGLPGSGSEEFIADVIDKTVALTVDENNPPAPNGPEDYGAPPDAELTRPTRSQPLKLTYFDESDTFAAKRWISKGLLARGETSAFIAPPGAGKSALMTEIAVHTAAGIDWRGHKAKEACGVVILALERADLYRRRPQAYRMRDGLQGFPIAVAGTVIDLLNPNCVDITVSTVRDAEKNLGRDVGLIIIDTYAKGIAANGGDEDKARDQNRAAANLRNVQAKLDVHIALVGHTGKVEERGARGGNAHLGDVDVMVQITGEGTKVAEIVKANDQPQRVVAEFKLEAFELGRDDEGDPVTTSIVTTDSGCATSVRKKPKKKELADKPKPDCGRCLNA
jgi:hypothetical protein